jgi:large subunit ribosomal protein L20
MTRTKAGFVTKKRHKKIITFNKGYQGSHSRLFKVANQENMKSLTYAYNDRRKKKGDFRKIWVKQISNAARINSIKYNELIKSLKVLNIELNRKMLSKLLRHDGNIIQQILKV